MSAPWIIAKPAVGHIPFEGHRTQAEVLGIPPRIITFAQIRAAVCEHYKLTNEELVFGNREPRFSHPRQVAMCLARKLTKHSTTRIAQWLGGLDHSTVVTGAKAAMTRPEALKAMREIEARLFEQLELGE